MLTLENVSAGYDATHVLSQVSLHVQEGEVVCLVGRNGAGKSSLLRSIVQDQIKVSSGRIQFRDIDLVGLKPYSITRQGIALVPEDRRVFPTLTVRDNLLVPKHPRGRRSTRWSIGEVYRLFPPLKEFSTRPAGVLSGGEQQMLSIGRSLLTNPDLLLLDEPNEGLAPIIVDSVVAAVRSLSKEGMSMLISEQSLHLVHECADRMYVIDRGSLVFEGTVEAFKASPAIAERHLMVM